MMDNATVLIVGAGLSGLTTANTLLQSCPHLAKENLRIIILEARERAGGRIFGKSNVDLGPAWTWRDHDREFTHFVNSLAKNSDHRDIRLRSEIQFAEGKSVLHGNHGVVTAGYGVSPCGDGGYRFFCGMSGVVSRLLETISQKPNVDVRFSCRVDNLEMASGDKSCKSRPFPAVKVRFFRLAEGTFDEMVVNFVVVAVPPALVAHTISFDPPLDEERRKIMKATPIWMGDAGKVAVVYERPFWRENGFSGTGMSDIGPLRQVWDNSTVWAKDGTEGLTSTYALAGFVFGSDLRILKSEELVRNHVLKQLGEMYGEEALTPLAVHFKAWCDEVYTSPSATVIAKTGDSTRSLPRLSLQCGFGHPLTFQKWGDGVVFASTETVARENGHMNGAVTSGLRAAREILQLLNEGI